MSGRVDWLFFRLRDRLDIAYTLRGVPETQEGPEEKGKNHEFPNGNDNLSGRTHDFMVCNYGMEREKMK